MRIIPVLDLAHGVAVHARAGDRSRYQPVRSVLAPRALGDPRALLRGYRERLGAGECYVADLDAIQGEPPQHALLRELAAGGDRLLVDAGAADVASSRALLDRGAGRVVVGLESLRSLGELPKIVAALGTDRLVFSLDLRHGRPVLHPELRLLAGSDPESLAAQALDAGVASVLVLDLARVGTGGGVDLRLLAAVRRAVAAGELLAGGGVRTRRDLERMRDAGCDGALVASALHAGEVGRADLQDLAGGAQSDDNASR